MTSRTDRNKARDYLKLMRPRQWIKNLFMAVGLLFSDKVTDPISWGILAAGIIIFSLVSSGIFIINDLKDREYDARHPQKKNRPLANGNVKKNEAVVFLTILLAGGIGAGLWFAPAFGILLIIYTVWSLLYMFKMKSVVILDVFAVSAGYVFRVIAGNLILALNSTYWILNCTFFLALLVSLGKRSSEISSLKENAGAHRQVLSQYSSSVIGQLMVLSAGLTIMFYALFTYQTVKFSGAAEMVLMSTIPVVVFAIMRYCYIVLALNKGEEPEVLIFKDEPIRYAVVVWLILIGVAMYLK